MAKPTKYRSPLLKEILYNGTKVTALKGEVILSSDIPKGVMMVAEGYIKRYLISNQGNLGVQIIYGPQDVFPLTHVFNILFNQRIYDGPEVYHYKTMSASIFYTVDTESFIRVVKDNPHIYKELFSEAGWHLKTSIHLIENISLRNAYQRVAHQVLFFARNFGVSLAGGVKIRLPLTHQDVADNLGLSRETVSLSFTQLNEKGLIKSGRNIIVPDIAELEAAAYS